MLTFPLLPSPLSHPQALYRALLRLAPTRKAHIQAVFRFFKVRTELSHQQVQQVLISALGLELVREAWAEARKEINEYVQAEVAYMLRPLGSSSSSSSSSGGSGGGTAPSSPSSSPSPSVPYTTSSAHATAMSLLQWQQQRQQNQQQQQQPQPQPTATHTRPRPLGGEEEGEAEARRVRPRTLMPRPMQPRAMLPRQSTMFWRALEAMPSASTASTATGVSAVAEGDVGISIVLASLSCPPPSPSLQQQDRSHSDESTTSTTTTAARAAAAVAVSSSSSAASRSIFRAFSSIAVSVDEGESELEDEDLLLQDAPNAFVCPISLQLMTRAVVAGDGFSYQREALDKWILRNRRKRKPLRSPMTNAPMAPFYTPSFTLRSMVGDFVDLARAKRRREGGVAHVVED